MQLRSGLAAVADEAGLSARDSLRSLAMKREWPLKVAKLLFLLVLLGAGALLGVVFSLNMSQYFTPAMFFSNSVSSCDPSSPSRVLGPNRWTRLQDWLAGPSLQHNMSDAELLWAASMKPTRRSIPVRRMPKVAFLFLTKGPLPLARLWERFFKGNQAQFSIYVHAAPGYTLDVSPSSAFYGRQVLSQEARWGEITICDAERRLLANALLDFSNERFILLSETCIPLYTFRTVYNHMMLSKHSFVGSFDDPGPHGRGRYNNQMEPVVSIEQWRKGSQWFEVNRRLAIYIVADTVYYSKFRDFCRPACYVDEHYLPTMLTKEFGSQISNRSLTWVDWSRGGPHPAMFGKDDITEQFIRGIQENRGCMYNGHSGHICFLFARKFSPNTLDPLLQLASKALDI